MRILLIGMLALTASATAHAQTFDPRYPVCQHNYRWGGEDYDCSFTSLAQCAASASGLSAICVNNPYAANASVGPVRRPARPRRSY
ncbi:DUF3551 domain-containing protein [Bradyrhizobium jicamae]|uniref:DUF3551 domain-containing protein n=1 Tax=Bradyrhizobium jicamae TaxID=280332 RepID=UPI001BA60181|nr:DUF3551 domain-containing protein [Bradyrhizobium jicamae]MBR0756798.1 DUF3551 domain-containing protein [Bradyrhizobium jicamae]